MLHASACWGRLDDIEPGDFLNHIFGDVLLQIIAGDFLQLNPVLSHSLMGSFGITVPGAPTYEQMDSLQREKKQELPGGSESIVTIVFGVHVVSGNGSKQKLSLAFHAPLPC